jgi:hypothetical protein
MPEDCKLPLQIGGPHPKLFSQDLGFDPSRFPENLFFLH